MSETTKFDVRCSCGRIAVLTIAATGFTTCDDPEWKYHAHPDPERDDLSRLWHCGRDGHYQAGLRDHDDASPAAAPGRED